ncbi:MAG: hypothetical protein WCW78_03945 [Candidatus Paceibacterota bacterium]|jgi:hypothetical protein
MSADDASVPTVKEGISDEQLMNAFLLLSEGGNKLHEYVGKILSDFVIAYNSLVAQGKEERALKFREEVTELFFKKLLAKVRKPYDQGVLQHTFGIMVMKLTPIYMEMKQTQVITSRSGHEPLFISERGRYAWLTNQGDGGKLTKHFGAE